MAVPDRRMRRGMLAVAASASFAALAGIALLGSPGAHAQAFPNKPVRFVVGYSPGGLPDTVARIVAQRLGDRWGQQVIVENRTGANGIVGADFVAKSAPDGYTLLVTDNSTTAINPHLYAKLAYDAQRDFTPVALAARAPLFLALHPSVEAKSFAELVDLVKKQPGRMSYGSSGIGSTHHLTMESVKAALGLDIVHVPYKGTGQSVPALLGGQVAMVFSAFPSLAPHARDGKVRLVAVNSARRFAQAPDLPTIAESGIAGFDFAPSIGILGPARLPADVAARIAADVAEVVRASDVVKQFSALGIEPAGESPREFAALLAADFERYGRAVRLSGAKAD